MVYVLAAVRPYAVDNQHWRSFLAPAGACCGTRRAAACTEQAHYSSCAGIARRNARVNVLAASASVFLTRRISALANVRRCVAGGRAEVVALASRRQLQADL